VCFATDADNATDVTELGWLLATTSDGGQTTNGKREPRRSVHPYLVHCEFHAEAQRALLNTFS
jgi:hypothetical protein